MNDELLREVQRWRRFAREDLQEAERQIQRTSTVPRHPAWLAQQAAEKAFKAVLIYLQVEFPFTHNLNALCDRIPDDWRVKQVTADLGRLSEYAVDARYPGDWSDISLDDAQAAVRDAQRIVDAVQIDLDARLAS
jgi:HEPN domain-containing protein